MWLFPLGAALVSAIFAAQLLRQFLAKHRPHQLAWTIALAMFAAATLATAAGVRDGWTPALFRAYYLFGAMINVPFLAAGTMYLSRRGLWRMASRPWWSWRLPPGQRCWRRPT